MESESLSRPRVSPQDLLDSSTNKHIQVNGFHHFTSQTMLIKAQGEMKWNHNNFWPVRIWSRPISSLRLRLLALWHRETMMSIQDAKIQTYWSKEGTTFAFGLLTHSRLTSSLQLTVASPWLLMALQEYTPPSKLPGLRISREQIPWTQICLNLGSSPIIIWFFIHWTLGCGERGKNNNLIFEWRNGLGKQWRYFYLGLVLLGKRKGKKKLWLKWTHSRPPPPHCGNFNSADRVRTSWGPLLRISCLRPCFLADLWPSRTPLQLRRFKEHNTASNLFIKSYWKTGGIMRPNGRWESRLPGQMKIQHAKLLVSTIKHRFCRLIRRCVKSAASVVYHTARRQMLPAPTEVLRLTAVA